MLIGIFLAAGFAAAALTIVLAALWRGWWSAGALLGLCALYFLACVGLWIAFLFVLSRFVDMKKPAGKNQKKWRRLIELTIDIYLLFYRVRIHVTGVERVPADTRFLFTCNHLANFDPMVAMKVLRRFDMTFISKKENFDMLMVGRLMHAAGVLSIDRENDRSAVRTIAQAARLLKEDYTSVGLYPEGYCKKDPSVVLQPFRDGSLKIAQKAQVPVVVATIRGTENVKRNFFRKLRTDVYFDVLAVLPAEELGGCSTHEIGERIWPIMYENLSKGACQA